LLVDRKAVDEERYKKATGGVLVGDAYLTANATWFDPNVVKLVQSIDLKELLKKGFILNDRGFLHTPRQWIMRVNHLVYTFMECPGKFLIKSLET